MFEMHISGWGWIVASLFAGGIASGGYVYGFYEAKRKCIAAIRATQARPAEQRG